eukprot:s395_g22.t1
MATPPARRGVLAIQVKEHKQRLKALETRLTRVEYTQKLQEAYRKLRIEHSDSLQEVWRKFKAKGITGREFKPEAVQAITQDIPASLCNDYDEAALEQKAKDLSNQKRGAMSKQEREHLCRDLDLTRHLEWIRQEDGGAFTVFLYRGEPSRIYYERLKKDGTLPPAWLTPLKVSSITLTRAGIRASEKETKGATKETKKAKAKAKVRTPPRAKVAAETARDGVEQAGAWTRPRQIHHMTPVHSTLPDIDTAVKFCFPRIAPDTTRDPRETLLWARPEGQNVLSREGKISPQWGRWSEVPEAWSEVQDRDPRMIEVCGRCRKCGLELQQLWARVERLEDKVERSEKRARAQQRQQAEGKGEGGGKGKGRGGRGSKGGGKKGQATPAAGEGDRTAGTPPPVKHMVGTRGGFCDLAHAGEGDTWLARNELDLTLGDQDSPYLITEAPGVGQVPVFRRIYTDGSEAHGKAGWAAVVFDAPPARPVLPDFVLFGPVILHAWDPNFLGEEKLTNNTGELSAIGEACLWLLDRQDERDAAGQVVGAEIHYDSHYARDLAVRVAQPKSNVALAHKVADLVDAVRATRPLQFRHVKGHSGDYGNDAADKFADLGAAGAHHSGHVGRRLRQGGKKFNKGIHGSSRYGMGWEMEQLKLRWWYRVQVRNSDRQPGREEMLHGKNKRDDMDALYALQDEIRQGNLTKVKPEMGGFGGTDRISGRGVDDALQLSRRIAEEVARVDSDEVVLLRFFDIEKAYPRVCREAMWEVLRRRGCPAGMVKVLQGLHEHTGMKVRIYGGCSGAYCPERGLREGCPSSPVLVNQYFP